MGDHLPSNDHLLFVGNPGVGKSTLLNSLIGSIRFKSGVSAGVGLTTNLQWCTYKGINYGDTPGLSDIKQREQAAKEITKALKTNGKYRLVFFCTLESGRVRSDDLTTISLVLKSINDYNFPFAIVINKVSKKIKEKYTTDPVFKMEIITCLNFGHHPTDQIFLYPDDEDLRDCDNILVDTLPEFEQFLNQLPAKELKAEEVTRVEGEAFESQRRLYEKVINGFDKMKNEYNREKEALLEKINKLENDNLKQQQKIKELENCMLKQQQEINKLEYDKLKNEFDKLNYNYKQLLEDIQKQKSNSRALILAGVAGGGAIAGPLGAVLGGVATSAFVGLKFAFTD